MAASLKDKLREHRKRLGYSLDDLARLSDSSKSYLWELENRDTRKPSAEKLTKIAEALEVTTGYLLDDKADMDESQIKEAFFRKFSRLDGDDKKRIQDMIEAWGKKK
jgi:transcriptional regulator with XRE-family HTH domain